MEIITANLESVMDIFSKYNINFFNIGKTGGDNIIVNNILNVGINQAKESWENGLSSKL